MLRKAIRIKESYSEWAEDSPYLATTLETVVFTGIGYVVEEAVKRHGSKLEIGNGNEHNIKTFASEHPVTAGITHVVIAPVIEEIIFTKIAPEILERDTGLSLNSAQTAADLAFALSHYRPLEDPVKIPLPQLLRSRRRTSLYNDRGLSHAVLSHVITNSISAGVAAKDLLGKG